MHSAKEPPLSIGGKKRKRRPERRACAAPPPPPRLISICDSKPVSSETKGKLKASRNRDAKVLPMCHQNLGIRHSARSASAPPRKIQQALDNHFAQKNESFLTIAEVEEEMSAEEEESPAPRQPDPAAASSAAVEDTLLDSPRLRHSPRYLRPDSTDPDENDSEEQRRAKASIREERLRGPPWVANIPSAKWAPTYLANPEPRPKQPHPDSLKVTLGTPPKAAPEVLTRRELAAQTIRYGTFEGVIVDPNVAGSAATARLPVVLLLQGSGGFWPKTKKKFGKDADINSLDIPLNCPKHCWYAYMQITGKNNRKLPDELMQFIRELHGMCKHEGNPIVAMGFSRGARWLEKIVRENSHYLEVAIIIAGYPENKDKVQNKSHAQELVKVKSTIVCMVHFISDFHCNTSIYPDWYGEFERASEPSVREIEDITSFNNFMLQGNHKDAEELWYNWHFAKVDDELNGWFEAMWEILESNQI